MRQVVGAYISGYPVQDIEASRRRRVPRAGCAAAQDDNRGEIFHVRALPGFFGWISPCFCVSVVDSVCPYAFF
jgi:hypothetical protein